MERLKKYFSDIFKRNANSTNSTKKSSSGFTVMRVVGVLILIVVISAGAFLYISKYSMDEITQKVDTFVKDNSAELMSKVTNSESANVPIPTPPQKEPNVKEEMPSTSNSDNQELAELKRELEMLKEKKRRLLEGQ